jgi:membrane-associated phospholipid phosphatase
VSALDGAGDDPGAPVRRSRRGGQTFRRLGRRRWGRTLGTGAAGVVVLFGATLLWGWLAGTSWGASLDKSWAGQLVAHRSASVTGALRWLTWLGDARAVLPLACALGAFLLWRRESRLAAVLVGSTWGALALSLVGKEMVVRPRPPEATRMVETISSALPSGHAAVAVALLGSLAWAVARHRHLLVRASAWAGAGVLALAVGCSRVYLGAHWPIDVLSAWTLGAGWLFTCIIASAPGQGSVRHVQAPARLRRVRLEVAPQAFGPKPLRGTEREKAAPRNGKRDGGRERDSSGGAVALLDAGRPEVGEGLGPA